MSAKSAFQILTGLYSSVWRLPFGRTLGETFEAFAIESDLRSIRRKDLERLLKICNNRLVSLFAERVATCNNMLHDWRLGETEFEFHAIPRKLRDRAIWK